MRRIVAGLLVAALGTTALADPPLRAGFGKPADPPKETAPMPKAADGKKKKEKPPAKEQTRAETLKALQDGYQMTCTSWVDSLHRTADDPNQHEKLLFDMPSPVATATGIARLVLDNPADEVALDGVSWLVRYQSMPAVKKMLAAVPGKKKDDPTRKLDLFGTLLAYHADNPKTVGLARWAGSLPPAEYEVFMDTLLAVTANADVRNPVTYLMADQLLMKADGADLSVAERTAILARAEALFVDLTSDPKAKQIKQGRFGSVADYAARNLRTIRELSVGKPLPLVPGVGLDEKPTTFAKYKGKVLLVDVWATWCGPCRVMFPHMSEMYAANAGKPFAIVGVNVDEELETATDFLKKNPLPWDHWWDTDDGPVSEALGVRFFPTTLLVDHTGTIRYRNVHDHKKLAELVTKLVKEAEAANGSAVGGAAGR